MQHTSDNDDSPYDYSSLIVAADAVLQSLKGRVLQMSLAQVVDPEYNQLFLVFADGSISICGRIGGEVLGIHAMDERPVAGQISESLFVVAYPAFEQFSGKRIVAVRTIGSAWNGHGFEFSFEGVFDRTVIVQSINTGDDPPDRSDCLRLGVGNYSYGWPAGTESVA